MNRKTHKDILNTASREVGRDEAKRVFGNRKSFIKHRGAWIFDGYAFPV